MWDKGHFSPGRNCCDPQIILPSASGFQRWWQAENTGDTHRLVDLENKAFLYHKGQGFAGFSWFLSKSLMGDKEEPILRSEHGPVTPVKWVDLGSVHGCMNYETCLTLPSQDRIFLMSVFAELGEGNSEDFWRDLSPQVMEEEVAGTGVRGRSSSRMEANEV